MKRLGLPLLLSVFIALGAIYAVVTPLFEISDELWHYPMVKTLADGHGLPVQTDPAQVGLWRQEGSQPPLYYVLMALATGWIDTRDMEQVRWLNPHVDNGIITPDGNNNIAIHTYREAWPWSGTVLAVRLIRLLSVLMAAGAVYFTYRLALELAPEQYGLALAAAGFAAFTPMFIFISASVNNDTLAVFFSAAALWLMARWVKDDGKNSRLSPGRWPALALMGLLLGGAALSKESALGLCPLAGAALLFHHLRSLGFFEKPDNTAARFSSFIFHPWPFVLRLTVVFGVDLAICGWWYWRNFQLYGDWLGWNAFVAIVGPRANPATLLQLWGERAGFVQAYWGLFGGVSVPMPEWTYTVLNILTAGGVLGLLIGLVRVIKNRQITWAAAALWALPVLWLVLIVVGLIRWTSVTWASQGRLIFPAISAISVLVVFGLAQLSSFIIRHSFIRHSSRAAAISPSSFFLFPSILFMAVLSAAVPFVIIAPHYAPPPELTAERLTAISHPVSADFGGEIKLLGYDLETPVVLPGEAVRLTLYWQSQIAMDRNWSIFVHVVDEPGIVVAQRDRYPGMGALATTGLRPGQTFADAYVIQVPAATYSPASAYLEVGLYDLQTGERLPLTAGGDALRLAPLEIRARPDAVPNALRQNFGNIIQLTGYTMDARVLRPGETLTITLYWEALAPMRINYSVFAHVRGEGQTLWAGEDAWPQKGAAPTSGWVVGQLIADTYQLKLKGDTPPGTYNVEVGLYDAAEMKRLQMIAADGRPTDADFIDLSKIRVVEP